ncbi:MAG TPA: ATP-binding protein [Chthoniobacterales bacterium]
MLKQPLNALIVDDSEDDTRLMLREFRRAGLAVVHERVETAEALQAALKKQPWDVLLSDYTMPLFSGMSALHITKESGLDLPFLFVSGTMGEDVVVEAMQAGADDYIVKSSAKRLVPAVERALQAAESRREHEKLKRTVTLEREQAFARVQMSLAEVTDANTALQEFAHVASHDLQEPLRAVAGCGQLLQRKYLGKLDPQAEQLIQMMVDGSARMKAMIAGLLAFSLAGRNENLETINANTALQQALAQLSSAIAESKAEIVAADLPTLRFAKIQLVQVLQNLVGNAIKYGSRSTPRIEVSARRQEDGWVFRVADNGIGFEPEYADKLFEIFKRLHTREVYPGTGIGLALVKRAVELRGGRIWAESIPGQGSTFFFTVPDREQTGAQPGIPAFVSEWSVQPGLGGSVRERMPVSEGEPGPATKSVEGGHGLA